MGGARARRGAGPVVNITSVGGKSALPFMAPYCASKFALEGLTESLRRELMLFAVKVIAIAPGMVATEMTRQGRETDLEP